MSSISEITQVLKEMNVDINSESAKAFVREQSGFDSAKIAMETGTRVDMVERIHDRLFREGKLSGAVSQDEGLIEEVQEAIGIQQEKLTGSEINLRGEIDGILNITREDKKDKSILSESSLSAEVDSILGIDRNSGGQE